MDEEDIQNLINTTLDAREEINGYGVSTVPYHTHNGTDSPIVTIVDLKPNNPVLLGYGGMISYSPGSGDTAPGSAGEEVITIIVAGKDQTAGVTQSSISNMQIQLEHYPQDPNNFSFFDAFRPPLYTNTANTTITVTAGGSTVTITGYTFPVNSLFNATTPVLIDIFDSSGNLVETQSIASNTATVITINGTWLNTTIGGTFLVFVPVFLGRTQNPWQRAYVMDSTAGGVRFGGGPTNAGQNGLLYMDSAGDLYWRNKSGTSTKLN